MTLLRDKRVLAIIGVLALAGGVWSIRTSHLSAGPLADPGQHAATTGITVPLGQRFYYGGTTIENRSNERAVLDAVSVSVPDGLTLEKVLIVPGASPVAIDVGVIPAFPGIRPVKGTVVLPGAWGGVLMQFHPTAPGTMHTGNVTVDYHVGDAHYRYVIPQKVEAVVKP